MRHERRSGGFAESIHDVHDTRRQSNLFEPVCDFHHRERCLLSGFQHAGAPRGNRRCQLPGGHHQGIVPRNDLTGDSHGFTQRKAQRVRGNRIDVAQYFVRQTGVIFDTRRSISDVVFRFDDRLA